MRILVADDSGVSRHLICSLLRQWGHEAVSAKDGIEAFAALRSDTGISLALVDWMMPGLDGLEVCRQLRAIPDRAYTYMISVTSKHQKQDLVRALEAGFDDFLTKPVQPDELNARLLVGSRIIGLQERLMQTCELSQFKATHDSLTGLWNRAAIMEFLRAQLALSVRNASNMGLMMVDIDHFKAVNDTYGHSVGDSVLIHVAGLMNSILRASDWVGRYGGEEFLVIASESLPSDAIQVAERLRMAVADNPFRSGEQEIRLTISIGVANTRLLESPTPELLVKIADAALYRAKNKGRNRVETDPGPPALLVKPEDRDATGLNSATH
jgi:diguanylate cyclase (GGDEF)-like protein